MKIYGKPVKEKPYINEETDFRQDFIQNHANFSNESLLTHFESFAIEMSTNGVFLYPEQLKLAYVELKRRKINIPDRKFAVDFCKGIYKPNK